MWLKERLCVCLPFWICCHNCKKQYFILFPPHKLVLQNNLREKNFVSMAIRLFHFIAELIQEKAGKSPVRGICSDYYFSRQVGYLISKVPCNSQFYNSVREEKMRLLGKAEMWKIANKQTNIVCVHFYTTWLQMQFNSCKIWFTKRIF